MSDLDIMNPQSAHQKAISDFQHARRKAALEYVMAFIQGKSVDLMSYEQVREHLRPVESARRVLEDIPLDRIVGSVNRTYDFTRSFLPRHESDVARWTNVRVGMDSLTGLPPIDAYRVGDVYFILDGHHRVSVAREMGAKHIQGYVTPVFTRVPLSPGDSPDDLIIKSEYADFLAKTLIDHYRPEADLMVSVPGQYQKLLEHISVHHYFMDEKRKTPVTEKEAIVDWYDNVYMPIAQLIRERNLLQDFSNRTETDLYLWIMDHRSALSQGGIGWEVAPTKAVADLTHRYSRDLRQQLPRITRAVVNFLTPEPFEPGPPTGAWRSERQSPHSGDRLFDDILVTVIGGKQGKQALRLAFEFARRENSRLTGLHVVADEDQKDSSEVQALIEDFKHQCADEGITGRLIVQAGQAAQLLVQRSPWVDLSIFRLRHPPSQEILTRLRSGVRTLIRHSVSPLLAVSDANFTVDSALLAYGPGPKSDEALFVAAYLAGCWKIPLTVVSATREGQSASGADAPLDRARAYLEGQQVEARYILEDNGDPAAAVLINAEAHGVGLIITGSYEGSLMKESLFGSTVDRILRSTRRPLLICR